MKTYSYDEVKMYENLSATEILDNAEKAYNKMIGFYANDEIIGLTNVKSAMCGIFLRDYVILLEHRDKILTKAHFSEKDEENELVGSEVLENINDWLLKWEHIFAVKYAQSMLGARKSAHLPTLHI